MKKILLTMIFLIYSLSAISQQIALSDTVNVKMPDGTERLSRDEFADKVNSKFNNSKSASFIVPDKVERSDNKHYFKSGNILVLLVHGKRPVNNKTNYLTDIKKYEDDLYDINKESTSYTSVIKTINNNTVLIIFTVVDNIGDYHFLCNDNTNSKALNGTLEFDIKDKTEATTLLYKILESVNFAK